MAELDTSPLPVEAPPTGKRLTNWPGDGWNHPGPMSSLIPALVGAPFGARRRADDPARVRGVTELRNLEAELEPESGVQPSFGAS